MLAMFVFFNCSAQHFSYSIPIGNYNYSQSHIIGLVKNNIIVWNLLTTNSLDYKKSEILVFNDKLELLNTTSFKSITPKLASVDFVNNGNTFEAIIQYHEDEFFICKLVNFDANGNILGTQTLDSSVNWSTGNYIITKSKGGSLALLQLIPSDISGTIAIRYHFIQNNLLIHSDKIILPFDTLSSELGNALLDENNLIIPVHDSLDIGERLALYKVDLKNNTSVNTLRNLNEGVPAMGSMNINANDKYYMITAKAKGSNQDFKVPDKIFLWQLNKDLTDVTTDTLLADIDIINPCLQNIYSYKLNSIALKNNTSDIIITAGNITDKMIHFFSPSPGRFFPVQTESFYQGRAQSMYNGITNLRQGAYYSYSPSNINHGLNRQQKKFKPQVATLAILNVDIQNNLRWSQCFNASMEKDLSSLVNESVFINTQNALHIIYSKLAEKNKQLLGDIILNHDGTYIIKPIISMNLKCTYMLNESVTLDSNSILIPCVIKNKLAFAKFTIE